jgi:Family of unknown function (DUF5946)
MNSPFCPLCGALLPDGFESCRAIFQDVCAREYSDPRFGAVHLLTVDAFCLQHSEECGPRSNAFHLMRLCSLLECGSNPALGQRPPRKIGKALEARYRDFPALTPPPNRGSQTVAGVHGAEDPEEHAERVRRWARSVWEAWEPHHGWARETARRCTVA